MYESTFDDDWRALQQEEAMFRAFALGVDAAFGIEHPEELRRLEREFQRGLLQIAFDEGKSRAQDTLRERDHEPATRSAFGFEPSDTDWEIWEELVEARKDEDDAFEMVRVNPSRDSLPPSLDRPELLQPSRSDLETLSLPRFLLR